MSDALKPCPFCGSTDVAIVQRRQSWVVGCTECPASVEDQAGQEGSEGQQVAISRWNRRPYPTPEGVAALIKEARDTLSGTAKQYPSLGRLRKLIELLCSALEASETARVGAMGEGSRTYSALRYDVMKGHIVELESQLEASEAARAALEKDNARLLRGDFTTDEFQNLCHNFSEDDKAAFCKGCEDYQAKLFGQPKLDSAPPAGVHDWAWAQNKDEKAKE